MTRPIGRKLASALWQGGTWAVVDFVTGRRGELTSLPTREARIAAIVIKAAIDVGMLVLIETSPEVIVLKIAVGIAWQIWVVQRRSRRERGEAVHARVRHDRDIDLAVRRPLLLVA